MDERQGITNARAAQASGIVRTAKRGNYSVISNEPLSDTSLTWEARGLLAYLLTKPDGWIVRVAHLQQQAPGGRDRFRRITKELETAGYMVRERHNSASGFVWVTTVYESPAEREALANREAPLPTSATAEEQPPVVAEAAPPKWEPLLEAIEADLGPRVRKMNGRAQARIGILMGKLGKAVMDDVPSAVRLWHAFADDKRQAGEWKYVTVTNAVDAVHRWLADGGGWETSFGATTSDVVRF